MSQLVVLNLGKGNWQQGLTTVIAQLWEPDSSIPLQITGSLPPATELALIYQRWRSLYSALSLRLSCCRHNLETAVEFDEEDLTHVSEAEFNYLCQQLESCINGWLDSPSFRPIEQHLRTKLIPSAKIRVIIETEDEQLRRLPWHLWSFFSDFPQAEVALATQDYERVPAIPKPKTGQVRILAILGNSEGIELEKDCSLLEQLPATEIVWLVEPQRRELDHWLWEEQGWDIFFFAGHSYSQVDCTRGEMEINPHQGIAIPQLKNALKAALTKGLQLAIFNSCDGLGLAKELADLQIPQLIVMREPVPDLVAQQFLKDFLHSFANGKSFYLAVREARERLQGLEDRFPCASWLPVIYQNPIALPPSWQELRSGTDRKSHRRGMPVCEREVTLVFTDLVNSTAVKNFLQGSNLTERNCLYRDTILKPYYQRLEANLTDYYGRVVKTIGDGLFLVFPEAVLAVEWAVANQISHINDPISTPLGPLQVRIGMHTGCPLPNNGDFIGQEVDYAARVSALASGGQILLSEVTAVLVRNAGIAGLMVHPHGEQNLKGIGKVPIFELLYREQLPHSLRSKELEKGKESLISGLWGRFCALLGVNTTVTTVLMVVRLMGGLQPLELWAYDQLVRWRSESKLDERLLVVKVTEQDIQHLSQYPLSDALILEALQKLEAHQPRAIGLDIYRDVPIEPGHADLVNYLQQNQRLIAICEVGSPETNNPEQIGIPPPAKDQLQIHSASPHWGKKPSKGRSPKATLRKLAIIWA